MASKYDKEREALRLIPSASFVSGAITQSKYAAEREALGKPVSQNSYQYTPGDYEKYKRTLKPSVSVAPETQDSAATNWAKKNPVAAGINSLLGAKEKDVTRNPIENAINKLAEANSVVGEGLGSALIGVKPNEAITTGSKKADEILRGVGQVESFFLPGGAGASSGAIRGAATSTAAMAAGKTGSKVLGNPVVQRAITGAAESVPYTVQQLLQDKPESVAEAAKTAGTNALFGAGAETAIAGLSAAAQGIFRKIKGGQKLTSAETEVVNNTPELRALPGAQKYLALPEPQLRSPDVIEALPPKLTQEELRMARQQPKKLPKQGIVPKERADFYSNPFGVSANKQFNQLQLPEGRPAAGGESTNAGQSMIDIMRRNLNLPDYRGTSGNVERPFAVQKGELKKSQLPSNIKKQSESIPKPPVVRSQPEWINSLPRIDVEDLRTKQDISNRLNQYNEGVRNIQHNVPEQYRKETPFTVSRSTVPPTVNKKFARESLNGPVPPITNRPNVEVPPIANAGKSVKTARTESIKDLVQNSDTWKDKSGLLGNQRLQRETEERNIIDIAGKKDGQKIVDAVFTPVHENEAARMRFLNEGRGMVKGLNLSKEESAAVQKFGEGKYFTTVEGNSAQTGKRVERTIEHLYGISQLKADFPNSWEKISNAAEAMKKWYTKALDMANTTLTRNGYKPIGKLANYFPHFEGDDPVMKALGIKLDVQDLPTDINGLTHQFRPGKTWFGNFLRRTGDRTTYDAVQGFDRYVEGISRVIYHTDDIQRLRTFTRELRLKYSPKETQDQVDTIMKSDMARELKDAAIEELMGRNTTHLSNYVANLDEYTNVLAGKKDLADRSWERSFGRGMYNVANFITNRIGRNMVAVNPGTWLTQFIPLTQAAATTSKTSFFRAMNDTLRSLVNDDGFVNRSAFLTNRYGSDVLDKTLLDKAGDVAAAPMRWIDRFTSQVTARAKYLDEIKKGASPEQAMKDADRWTANIISDRSLGAQPALFNQRNPFIRAMAQFQLEVNNQLSFLFKDMPREYLKDGANAKNIAMLTSAIGQLVFYGWAYNQAYEQITGRRPALDPIGIAFDFKEDLNNSNLKKSDAIANLGKNVTNQLPFAGSFTGGGRIPISTALPDVNQLTQIGAQMIGGEITKEQGLKKIGQEVGKSALYIVPPFGGGQAKKTFEGLWAVKAGGEYSTNAKGEKALKYPVAKTPENMARAALFGKSSLPETRDYYRNKVKPLGTDQTAAYDEAIKQGIPPEVVYNQIIEWRNLEPLANHKGVIQAQQIDALKNNKELTEKQREAMYYLFLK